MQETLAEAPIVGQRDATAQPVGEPTIAPFVDRAAADHQAKVDALNNPSDRTGWDTINDAWHSTIGVSVYSALTRTAMTPDDTYTKDRYMADYDAMLKTGQIDEETLANNIGSPVSHDDFNAKAGRIFDHQNTVKRLAQDGFFPSLGANIIAGMADPATIALGIGSGSLLKAGIASAGVSRAAMTSYVGRASIGGVDAMAQGVASVGIHNFTDPVTPDLHEYLMAAGTGLVMHGVVHGITEHGLPAAMRVGKNMQQQAAQIRAGTYAVTAPNMTPAPTPKGVSWHEDNVAKGIAKDALKADPVSSTATPEPSMTDHAITAMEGITGTKLAPEHVEAVKALTGESSTGLSEMGGGMADGIGASLRAHLWDRVQNGKMSEMSGFPESPLLKAAKLERDAGKMSTPEQFEQFLKDYSADHNAGGSHTAITKLAQEITPGPQDPYSGSAGAAVAPGANVRPHDFNVSEPAQVANSDVAYSFGANVRPGIGAYMGRHRNPVVRMMGGAFFNDMSGKYGHALNGQAAQLNGIRINQRLAHAYEDEAEKQFQAWSKRTNGPTYMQGTAKQDFHSQVTMEVTGMNKAGEAPRAPEVKAAADAFRKVMKEYAEFHADPLKDSGGGGRPIGDGGILQHDPAYAPREYAHRKMMDAFVGLQSNGMHDLFTGAILAKQPHLNNETAGVIAKSMIDGIMDRSTGAKNGVHGQTGGRDFGDAFANGDRDAAYSYLRRTGMDHDQATRFTTDLFASNGGDGGVSNNMKSRVLLDHNYSVKDAAGNDFYFHDLLEHNASKLLSRYGDRNAGRIAMGQIQLRNPSTGELLINGITRDSEFVRLKDEVAKSNSELVRDGGMSVKAAADTENHMQFAYDRMVGRPLESNSGFAAEAMKVWKATWISKMVNAGMFAHATEGVMSMSQSGVKAWLQHNPTIHMLTGGKFSSKEVQMFNRELNSHGYGIEHVHGMHDYETHTGHSEFDAPPVTQAEKTMRAMSDGLTTMNHKIMDMSQLPKFLDRQQTKAAAGMAQRFYDMAEKMQNGTKLPRGWEHRLAHMDISPEMGARIGAELKLHAKTKPGMLGDVVHSLDFNAWTDHEARAALDSGIFRMSRKMVQSQDASLMGKYISAPMTSLLMQFKSFVLQAWSNHTLYALHNMDFHMFAGIMSSTVMAGMLYATHHILASGYLVDAAQGKPMSEELKQKLSAENIGMASFQRAGWSSIIPNMIDGSLGLVNHKGYFDTRASGFSSTFVPPSVQSAQHVFAGIEAGARSLATGQKMSVEGIKNLMGVIPGSTFAPIQGLIEHYANQGGRMKYEPKTFTPKPIGHSIPDLLHKITGN